MYVDTNAHLNTSLWKRKAYVECLLWLLSNFLRQVSYWALTLPVLVSLAQQPALESRFCLTSAGIAGDHSMIWPFHDSTCCDCSPRHIGNHSNMILSSLCSLCPAQSVWNDFFIVLQTISHPCINPPVTFCHWIQTLPWVQSCQVV